MKLSASLTLTRLEGAVQYGIRLTPASVSVDSLTGAVTPATPVRAVPYRTEGSVTQDIDPSQYNQEDTSGNSTSKIPNSKLRYVIYCSDGSTIKNNSDTLLPEYIGVPETAAVVFEYIIDDKVVALQPLQINRSGTTYQPLRIRLWDDIANGSVLYPGNNPADPYTDLVFTYGQQTTDTGKPIYYKCIAQFSKAAGYTPQQYVTSGNLMAAADYVLIATQVLLAQNAYIDLLATNSIRFYASGAVTGGMSGTGDTRIWAGATYGSRDTAPFRVGAQGDLYALAAYIAGRIQAQILELAVDTSGDQGIPDGAICYNKSQITLPELEQGAVRTIKILNPLITRATPEALKLIPQNANVLISAALDYQGATSETKEIASAGANGEKYYELLGIHRPGTTSTVWLTREL